MSEKNYQQTKQTEVKVDEVIVEDKFTIMKKDIKALERMTKSIKTAEKNVASANEKLKKLLIQKTEIEKKYNL